MRGYLPPIGTAGFERVEVNGNNREPWPPPRMIASVSADISIVVCAKEPPPRERAGRRGISVIVCAHNQPHYLPACLHSVLAQSHHHEPDDPSQAGAAVVTATLQHGRR